MAINPYTLPPDLQGWRGESIPGAHKRKWFTLVENDKCLVTALLLIPGEVGIRHSHESRREDGPHRRLRCVAEEDEEPRPSMAEALGCPQSGNPVEARGRRADRRGSRVKASGIPEFAHGSFASLPEAHVKSASTLIVHGAQHGPRPAPSACIVDVRFPPFNTTIL